MDLDNQKKDTQTPTTVDSVTDNDAPKSTTLNNTLDFGVGSQEITDQVAEKIKHGTNILIALSKDPNLDEISAAIALAIILDQQKKHVTAIYSGKTPNALEFLKPEETFQKDTSSLQDFIIALNKSKADHLTYQIDGDYVKIFITPYKRQVTKEDLEYSYGDYNVDLVIVFNVNAGSEIDSALSEYGRIMHDATAINITSGVPGHFADLEWSDPSKSSVCEMVYDLINVLDIDSISQEVATALLTGILSATERFANNRTKPTTMAVASKLMEAGADQQLISSNILKPEPSSAEAPVNNQNQTLNTTSPYNTQNTDNLNSSQDLDTGERELEQLVNQNINSTSLASNQVPDQPGPFNTSISDSSNQASFTAPATNVMDDLARATDDLMNNHQNLQSQTIQQQSYQPVSSQHYSPADQSQPSNQAVQANQFDYQPTQNYQSPQVQNYPPKQPLSSPVQSLFNPSTQSAETSQLNSAQQSSLDSSIQSPQTASNNYQTVSQLDQSGPQPSNNQFQVPVSQQSVDQYQTQQLNQFLPQSAQPFTGQNQFQTNLPPADQSQPSNQAVQANQFDYQPTQNYQSPQAQNYPSEQSSSLSQQPFFSPSDQLSSPSVQPFSNTSQPIANSSPQPFSNLSAQSIEAPQPNPVQQPSFREQIQPTSNPEVFGHTIAEPVAEPEQDMSRLMDEALAEPSPIQNPVGYQSMINQSNYINQSLAQNHPSPEKMNYPLAVGQQPIIDYVPGQNLATISAPTIPSVQQNLNYPNPEYTNTVPNYQAPTMPALPNNPSQTPPAPSPIVPPSTQSVPNMQSNPAAPNPIANQQASPSPMQATSITESHPVDIQSTSVPQQFVPPAQTMPAQDFIQTTPPATSTPIPDYLRPDSFLPPAPNPVILDQSAPPIMPPVTPDSASLFPPQTPLTSPQPEQPQQISSRPQPFNNQVQAPVSQQPVNLSQTQPLDQTSAPTQPFPPSLAQDNSQPLSQAPASPQSVPVNPVQTDPSAFHIPGSY